MGNNKIWLAAVVAAFFVVIAITGSVVVSRNMNRGADEHAMSAGRAGDPKPNTAQQMEHSKESKTPSTTGTMTNNNVPPASR